MNKMYVTIFFFLVVGVTAAAPSYQIWYDAEVVDAGAGRWQYTYEVKNVDASINVEEFTIYFDYGLYDNIVSESVISLASDTFDTSVSQWNELIWQPLGSTSPGVYDGLALDSGIESGQSVKGFSVSFDWLGDDTPGDQLFDIVDNIFYGSAIYSGQTELKCQVIPAPSAIYLTLMGLVILKKRQKA